MQKKHTWYIGSEQLMPTVIECKGKGLSKT